MNRLVFAVLAFAAAAVLGIGPALAQAQGQTRAGCFFLECLLQNNQRGAPAQGGGSARSTKQMVAYTDGRHAPGSIVVKTPERALYLVMPDGKALRYKVGVGREGFQWSGNGRISRKAEWPDWRPPARMIAREKAKGNILPAHMPGGPNNPLGARALYIGGTLFRIHGTNAAESIGGAVSSGCIRMLNNDVIDLYEKVKVGAKVYVYQ
jgi:lipoprotein-anchoring transpeptidase ErfK/SrfK